MAKSQVLMLQPQPPSGVEADRPKSAQDLVESVLRRLDLPPLLHGGGNVPSAPVVALAPADGSMAGLRAAQPLSAKGLISRMVTFSPQQHLYALEALALPISRVEMMPPPVDTSFFSPQPSGGGTASEQVLVYGFSTSALPVRMKGKLVQFPSDEPSAAEALSLFRSVQTVVLGAPERSASGGLSTLLRAMACGCAVVAPRTYTMEYLLSNGKNCLDYDPANKAELGSALSRIAADPELAMALGKAGRKFAVDHCSAEHFSARLGLILTRMTNPELQRLYYVVPGRIAMTP